MTRVTVLFATLTALRASLIAHTHAGDTLRKKRRPAVPFAEKFAAEVLAVLQGTSPLLSRRAEMHREALANRSQAPARWGIGYKV